MRKSSKQDENINNNHRHSWRERKERFINKSNSRDADPIWLVCSMANLSPSFSNETWNDSYLNYMYSNAQILNILTAKHKKR